MSSSSSLTSSSFPENINTDPKENVAQGQEAASAAGADAAAQQPALSPLTPAQFREYNRLSEHMNYFHDHFRQVWTMIYEACEKKKRPPGMSIRQFLDEGLQFTRMLTAHHSIEETYFFPLLAHRMPEFQQPNKKGGQQSKSSIKAAELVMQHGLIHAGMDGFEEYLKQCRSSQTELQLSSLKAQMDTWGEVLWKHLDEEVVVLGAENMRKYWTLEEVRRIRI